MRLNNGCSSYDPKFTDLQEKLVSIKPSWILLDTQSSCDIFKNREFLQNIHTKTDGGLILKSNGNDDIRTCEVGTIEGYGEVWYHEDSLANILSFANVRKRFKVTISTGPDDPCPTIFVHRPNGEIMEFRERSMGLYVYDVAACKSKPKQQVTHYSFLNTIDDNELNYSKAELKRSQQALKLYRRLGLPAPQSFIDYLNNNWIHDLPFTSADAKRAFEIYGTDPAHLMGKPRRQKPPPVPQLQHILLPASIAKAHSDITVSVDIFYLNGIRFFHSISHHIKLRTVEAIKNATQKSLVACVRSVITLYRTRGFNVIEIRGDQQFECIKDHILPTHLYISTAGEHIPEVERSIQTIEGDCRSIFYGLPYRWYPSTMLKALVRFVVQNRNLFPPDDGVSTTYGPSTIVTGLPMPTSSYFVLES